MTKGQRIKARREELQIAQVDLAKRVGITKQLLYKYETEIVTNIPSDVIERLADALNCSPAYIMGWEDYNDREKARLLYQQYLHAPEQARQTIDYILRLQRPDSDPLVIEKETKK